MFAKLSVCTGALLLVASSAVAQFEGAMEARMTIADVTGASQGTGTMKILTAKSGTRSQMHMEMGGMNMDMVMVIKPDQPNVIYRINDASKTYSEMDLSKFQPMAAQPDKEEKYTVTKLGEEKLLGYKVQHVLVMQDNVTNELWTAKEVADYGTFSRLQARPGGRSGQAEALAKALKEAGADGMPLKAVTGSEDGGKIAWEIVKMEKQAVPAAAVDIPAGYTKAGGGMMGMMEGMSGPEADKVKKQMQDALKDLPPEQREMLEKMMKQRMEKGGKP